MQGDLVSARAGHAGVAMDGNWYIVGGGDNNNGTKKLLLSMDFYWHSMR